jgi:hypothetical protein
MEQQAAGMVCVPLRTAELIERVFVPRNPNKMRGADPDVVKAAHEFKAAVRKATGGQP